MRDIVTLACTECKQRNYTTTKNNRLERLREENTKHRQMITAIIDGNPDALIVVDGEGVIRYANPSAESMFGHTHEELVGTHFGFPLVAGEKTEIEIVNGGGGHRMAEMHVSMIEWEGGGAYLATLRDVTERHRMEEQLRESQRAMATLLSNLPGMAYRCRNDDPMTMLLLSEGCRDLTGYEPSDLSLGGSVSYRDLIHPDDRGRVLEEIRRAVAHGRPYMLTYRIRTARDEEKWVWEQGRKVLSMRGEEVLEGFVTDITERKRAEMALEKTVEQLRKKSEYEKIISEITRLVHTSLDLEEVFENAVESLSSKIDAVDHVAIYMVEGDKARIVAQRGYDERLLEETSEIPYGEGATWRVIFDEESRYIPDVDEDDALVQAGRAAGSKSYLVVPIRYDGETVGCIHIHSYMKNAFDEDELQLLEIVAKQIEGAIQNAKRAEALQISEEKYRTLFEESPVGVYLFDTDLVITNCNRRLVEMLDTSRDAVIGLEMRKLKDKKFLPAMEKVFEGETTSQEGWYEATTSGRKLWLQLTTAPLRDAAGRIMGGMAVVQDITERKEAERRIKEQAALLDNAREAILVTDLKQNIRYWNAGAERLYGWKSEEVMGKNLGKEVVPVPKEAFSAVLASGEWSGELAKVTKDGREIVVESRWTLVLDENGRPKAVLIIDNDITERKMLESQILRAQKLENLGTLASGIAHDLNNILQPIMMSIQILRTKVDDDSGRTILEMLEASANRGADLVKQILSFARGVESRSEV